jgi:outer membrane receptor protein involved in Fe transport
MKNLIVFTLAILFFSIHTQAQDAEIDLTGTVIDSLGEPIIAASIMLTSKADSVLAGFSLTDGDGGYLINKIPSGEYFIQVTYMGYKSHVEYVNIDATQGDKEMENITLSQGNTLLEEVLVMEDRIPILIKKDTIEYNAGSFAVRANATVEELLKEMPGIEIEEDGTIKAQGKEVTKLLVDGEEFFGNDPTLATKNLPAKAVDKVQVYDEKTEAQKLSGLEGGEKEKTINLKLKEDYKKGYFGKAMAGGGTAKRFAGELNLNKFDKKNQFSIVSKFNNINNNGFSFREYADFMGGFSNLFGGDDIGEDGSFSMSSTALPVNYSNSTTDGEKTSGILGMSFNKNLTEKIKLNSYYTFNMVDDNLISDINRTNFITGQEAFSTVENNRKKSRYYNNNANFKLTFEIDSTQKIKFNNTFGHSIGKSDNTNSYTNSNTSDIITRDGNNDFDSKNSSGNIRSTFTYLKRFKPGRVLSSSTNFRFEKYKQENNTRFNNDYFDEEGNLISQDSLDRVEDDFNSTLNWSQKLTYVEPIGKYIRWSNSYTFRDDLDKQNNDAEDLENSVYTKLDELSRDFNFRSQYHELATKIEYTKKKWTVSAGSDFRHATLSIDEGNTNIFKNPYRFVLPKSSIRFKISNSSSLSTSYRTSYRMPSFNQLQPLTNNTDPLRIYVGNTALDPEYTHRVRASYNLFDNFSFTSIFINASHSITPNSIINSSIYDEFLVETQTPINNGKKTNSSLSISYGRPLKFIKSRLDVRLNTSYSKRPYLLNEINSNRKQFTQSVNTSISNKKKKVVDTKISYALSYNKSMDEDATREDVIFLNHTLSSNLSFNFPKGWRVGTAARYQLFTSSSFAEDNYLLVWDAFLEKTLFKNEKGTLRLAAADLLNQNRGFKRSASAFYTREENTNNIGRFVMLTFSYNISFFGKGSD